MRAVRCKRYGGPETLVVEDVPVPQPGPGEVRITVMAAGVNFPDALIIRGEYQYKPPLPFTPGSEVAGLVSAVGPDVTRVRVGERVIGFAGWGGFAEEAVVPADNVVPMPGDMPFDLAGAFLMTYGTCWHAFSDRAQLRAGETVLVLGAAGGIGIASIEVAKALGARVIAAASSEEKLQACREKGADETINYTTEDLRERLKALTGGRGVDVVCDPVGGPFSEPALRSVGWRGRFLAVGFTSGEIARIPLNLPLLKGSSIVGVFWGEFLKREPALAAQQLQALMALYQSGRIAPLVSMRCGLDTAGSAIAALAQRHVTGKAVVIP